MSTAAAASIVDTSSWRFRFLRERSRPDPSTAGTAATTRDRPGGRPARADGPRGPERDDAVVFDRVSLAFDEQVVLRDLSFRIQRGAMMILLGGSGAGKSIVLRLILGLLRPDAGTIQVQGHRVDNMAERDLLRVRADIGMLFQENALFDSLTVADNVGYRLYEETDMPAQTEFMVLLEGGIRSADARANCWRLRTLTCGSSFSGPSRPGDAGVVQAAGRGWSPEQQGQPSAPSPSTLPPASDTGLRTFREE